MEKHHSEPGGIVELWGGIGMAPLAWALQLQANYMLATLRCSPEGSVWAHGVNAVALALGAAGMMLALRSWRRVRGRSGGTDAEAPGRVRFMAIAGLALSGLFLLVILVTGIPVWFMTPCE